MANVITTLLKMDATQLRTGLKGAQQSIRETDGVINKAKAGWASAFAGFASSPVAIGAASAAVGAFAASSVKAASDLNESINAVNVTFGESADEILKFGENAAKSVGLAQSEFNQLATPLGAILKNAGTPLDEVADKTIVLTQRAADMASVFNTDVSDALTAIQAGLRGEQDPLERFGVSLSAAKVEARALADTGKDNVKALTDQEKQLARVEIILDQTNQTAGDFANTSGNLANQTRILNAELENAKAKIGSQLIPALSDLAQAAIIAADGIEFIQTKLDQLGGDSGGHFNLFTGGIGAAINAVKDFNEIWKRVGDDDPAPTLDRGADSINRVKDAAEGAAPALTATATAATAAADEVVDLGDKAANAGPKIGDMAGALDDAARIAQDAADNAFSAVANAIQGVGQAVDDAFANFNDQLDQLDQLDRIAEDFTKAQEEGGKATRDLRRDLARFLQDLDGIPPDKKVEILAEIRNGNIDQLKGILDDLTKDRFINVNINAPKIAGFSSVSGLFSPTQATPIINGANPAPTGGGFVDARTVTNIFPIGSTPTSQYIDSQTDLRRNGIR